MHFLAKYIFVSMCLGCCYGAEFVVEMNCSSVAQCEHILDLLSMEINESLIVHNNGTLPTVQYKDFDECVHKLMNCANHSRCVNLYSSYKCECLEGYKSMDSQSAILNCTDVDECSNLDYHNCWPDEWCENTIGSYECRCIVDGVLMSNRCYEPPGSVIPWKNTTKIWPTHPSTFQTKQKIKFTNLPDAEAESSSLSKPIATTLYNVRNSIDSTVASTTTKSDIVSLTSSLPLIKTTSTAQTNPKIQTLFVTSTSKTVSTTSNIPTTETTLKTVETILTIGIDPTKENTFFPSHIPTTETTLKTVETVSTFVIDQTKENVFIPSHIPTSEIISISSSSVVNLLSRFNISNTAIEAGNITNEKAQNLISNLTLLIIENPVNESQARAIVDIFSLFASSSVVFEQSVSSQITQLAEDMLNTMILSNGYFNHRTEDISVAALDVTQNSSRDPFVSSFVNNSSQVRSSTIALPQSLYIPNQRISFAGYRDAKLFQANQVTNIINTSFNFDRFKSGLVINSGVIGSSLNGTSVMNLIDPVRVTLPTFIQQVPEVTQQNLTTIRRALYNARCVFYDYSANGGIGDWSSEGCVTILSEDRRDVSCQCNHLTSFAVIMSVETIVDDQILNIVSYVGCALSIFGLVASILTYSLFRQLRKHKSKQILLHFCVALLGIYIVYIFGIIARFPSNQSQCIASGFFLHYFVAATFSWMMVEVVDMYLMFVKVWSEISSPVKKAALFAWGFPFLLAIATLCAHFALERIYPDDQSQRLYPLYRDTVVCWLAERGLYWAFFFPLGVVLFINIIFFSIVIYHVTCKRASSPMRRVNSSTKKVKARQHMFNATAILLLTGPTWVIGFLINLDPISDGPIRRILSYLFVILNGFQGLWIFIVFTIRPQAVRLAWKEMLFGKSKWSNSSKGESTRWKKTKTSSSYISQLTKRKSSTDIRRPSAAASINTLDQGKSKKLQKIDIDSESSKAKENSRQYRYSNSPPKSDDSLLDIESSGRNSSAESSTNSVLKNSTAAVNLTFNDTEKNDKV